MLPPGVDHQITCKFTDLLKFRALATLPVNGLTFSKVLCGSGAWQGSLNVEDETMRKSAWIAATAVNKSALWVDIDGALLYGGITTGRAYQLSTGKVALSGSDFSYHLSQRLQARDYTAFTDPDGNSWAVGGASPLRIAYWIIKEAFEKAFSVPIKVAVTGDPEKSFFITFSAPSAQQQTVASLLSQLQEMGYLIGIDYACDVAYDEGGTPTATITLSYPRRGAEVPLTIEVSGSIDLQYSEDGTYQADKIVEQAGATSDRSSSGIWLPAKAAGYPLLEASISHTALAPTQNAGKALEAYVGADLAALAYPQTAPVVVLPLFGSPSIFDLDVGDNVILKVPVGVGALPANVPQFPNGLEFTYRIVRIDVSVPDEGLPTMALTLNQPPTVLPVEPAVTVIEGEGGASPTPEEKEAFENELVKAQVEEIEETKKDEEEKTSKKEAEEKRKKEKEEHIEKEKALEEGVKAAEECCIKRGNEIKKTEEELKKEIKERKEEKEEAENRLDCFVHSTTFEPAELTSPGQYIEFSKGTYKNAYLGVNWFAPSSSKHYGLFSVVLSGKLRCNEEGVFLFTVTIPLLSEPGDHPVASVVVTIDKKTEKETPEVVVYLNSLTYIAAGTVIFIPELNNYIAPLHNIVVGAGNLHLDIVQVA